MVFEQPNQVYIDKRVLDAKFKKYAVAMIQTEKFADAVKLVQDALHHAEIEFIQKARFGMEIRDFFFGKPGPTPLPGVFLEPARGTKGVWMIWMYFTIPESAQLALKEQLTQAFFSVQS